MLRFLLPVCIGGISFLPALPASSQSLPSLLAAIKINDTLQVNKLLIGGASVSVADKDGDNALMYAALYSTRGCMEQLLKKGADPDMQNKLGETAILWCTHDLEKTKLLLSYKAGLNIKTTTGNTAFLSACVGANQTDMIRLMLQNGADPLAQNHGKQTSLQLVAGFGDTAAARLLLNRGVEISPKAGEGNSALFAAVKGLNSTMLHWLLANGADANSHDSYNATPLSYAVILNNMEMVKALLPKTTNINEQDIDGITPLMWACYNEHDNPAIIQALLDAGAAVKPEDKKGQTALDWALKKGNSPTVALLKNAGATTGKIKPAVKK